MLVDHGYAELESSKIGTCARNELLQHCLCSPIQDYCHCYNQMFDILIHILNKLKGFKDEWLLSKNYLEFENSIPIAYQHPRYNTIHHHLQSRDYDNNCDPKLVDRVRVGLDGSIFGIFCQIPFLSFYPCNPNQDY